MYSRTVQQSISFSIIVSQRQLKVSKVVGEGSVSWMIGEEHFFLLDFCSFHQLILLGSNRCSHSLFVPVRTTAEVHKESLHVVAPETCEVSLQKCTLKVNGVGASKTTSKQRRHRGGETRKERRGKVKLGADRIKQKHKSDR